MSLARQNYSKEAETCVDAQINKELQAFYAYLSMASWCNRDTVSLPGLAAFFSRQSREEHQHALRLIEYQAKRGGKTTFVDIGGPANLGEWKSAAECLECALEMERDVNASLLQLHALAEKNNDPQLEDFVEQAFLDEQVESIKEMADLVSQAKRAGTDGLGLFLFDIEVGKRATSTS
jgi:ferritin heavy chain